jgi:tetratricopeptide (TPR) repeat protein
LHTAIAEIAVWTEWDWEKGEREFRKALEINPSDAGTRVFYAHLLDILQRTDEALLQGRIADELEPLDPMIQSLYSVVLGCTGDWKGMLAQLDKALALDPGHYFAKQLVDLAAFNCGDYDRVIPAFRSYMPFPESFFDSVDIVYHQEGINKACEMVAHEMERTGWGCPWAAATVYSYAKQYDRVLDLLEAGYEIHEPNMPYITISFEDCDSVYNNPRFIALVKKMNLPLPKID